MLYLADVVFFPPRSDFLRSNSDLNTKFFSELLTINLMKLEKVSGSGQVYVRHGQTKVRGPDFGQAKFVQIIFFPAIPAFHQ